MRIFQVIIQTCTYTRLGSAHQMNKFIHHQFKSDIIHILFVLHINWISHFNICLFFKLQISRYKHCIFNYGANIIVSCVNYWFEFILIYQLHVQLFIIQWIMHNNIWFSQPWPCLLALLRLWKVFVFFIYNTAQSQLPITTNNNLSLN